MLKYMARPLRLEFAAALYHVTSRRDGQEAIYRADGDRRMFLDPERAAIVQPADYKNIWHPSVLGLHFFSVPERRDRESILKPHRN